MIEEWMVPFLSQEREREDERMVNAENEATEEMEISKENSVILESTKIMLQVPVNAVEITVECVVYEDGKTQKVAQHLDLSDIRAAMKDAEENYIDPDEMYYLSDSCLGLKDDE